MLNDECLMLHCTRSFLGMKKKIYSFRWKKRRRKVNSFRISFYNKWNMLGRSVNGIQQCLYIQMESEIWYENSLEKMANDIIIIVDRSKLSFNEFHFLRGNCLNWQLLMVHIKLDGNLVNFNQSSKGINWKMAIHDNSFFWFGREKRQ